MTTTNFHIGLAIKQLAEKKKCSAETLAQRMGIVRQSVYDTYERETVRKSTVKKYADAIGISEDEIYQLAGFKPDNSKQNTQNTYNEGDGYLMRYLAELEITIKELRETVRSQAHTIEVLAGKSGSVSIARFAVFFIGFYSKFGCVTIS